MTSPHALDTAGPSTLGSARSRRAAKVLIASTGGLLAGTVILPSTPASATVSCNNRAHAKTTAVISVPLGWLTEAETREDYSWVTDGSSDCHDEIDGITEHTDYCYFNPLVNDVYKTSCTGYTPPSNYKNSTGTHTDIAGAYEADESAGSTSIWEYFTLYGKIAMHTNGSATFECYHTVDPGTYQDKDWAIDEIHCNDGYGSL